MHVKLRDDLVKYVEDRIRRGDFADESHAVAYALSVLQDNERDLTPEEIEELRAQLDPAIAEADRGETEPWDADEIIREGRRLLRESQRKAT